MTSIVTDLYMRKVISKTVFCLLEKNILQHQRMCKHSVNHLRAKSSNDASLTSVRFAMRNKSLAILACVVLYRCGSFSRSALKNTTVITRRTQETTSDIFEKLAIQKKSCPLSAGIFLYRVAQ